MGTVKGEGTLSHTVEFSFPEGTTAIEGIAVFYAMNKDQETETRILYYGQPALHAKIGLLKRALDHLEVVGKSEWEEID